MMKHFKYAFICRSFKTNFFFFHVSVTMADKRSAGGNNEEKELAQIARKEFEAKNFSACMDKLKSLSSLLQNNPKIQHNMCVCHFHQSGFQHVENLKKGLKQVCNLVS